MIRHNRYIAQDPTDDEDSGDELEAAEDLHRPRSRREILANRAARRGGRKMSTQSNFEIEINPVESDTATAALSTSRNRFSHRRGDPRRGGSVARSLHEYPITGTLLPNRLKKNQPTTEKARSDSLTSTSETNSDKNSNLMLKPESEQQSTTHLKPMQSENAKNNQDKEPEEASAPLEVNPQSKTNARTEKWQCEHCTFFNEPEARICAICCKTSTRVLETLPPSPVEIITDLEQTTSELLNIKSKDQVDNNTLSVKEGRKNRKITFGTSSKKVLKFVK